LGAILVPGGVLWILDVGSAVSCAASTDDDDDDFEFVVSN
jgi:hypothetical protein